jgi:hypothetical protein
VGTYAAAAYHDDESRAELLETIVGEEDAVASKLFQDELCSKISFELPTG